MTFTGKDTYPTLGKSLQRIGYNAPRSAPFHNAANDAWFALELLFLEAEQALKQLTDPAGEDTINWMAPPAAPRNSPVREDTISKQVYGLNLSTPTITPTSKRNKSAATSSRPDSQTLHTTSGGSTKPTSRRQKKRKRAKPESSAGDDTMNLSPAATPTDANPPAKKRKLTHESDVTEKESEGTSGGGTVEGSGGSRDSVEGEAEVERQDGKESKEGSEGGSMFVTSGTS